MPNQSPGFDHDDGATETGFAATCLTLIFVGYADDDLEDARGVIHNMARYEWGRGPVRIATGTWADIVEYRLEPGEVAVAYPALGVATQGRLPPGIRVIRDRRLHTVLTADTPSEVARWLALPAGDDVNSLAALFNMLDANGHPTTDPACTVHTPSLGTGGGDTDDCHRCCRCVIAGDLGASLKEPTVVNPAQTEAANYGRTRAS